MATTFTANQLPTRVTLWHDESTVIVGNAITSAANASQVYNLLAQQGTPTLNNSFSQSVFLRAGFYSFYVLGATDSTKGQITWALDGVNFLATQEWYSASAAFNVIQSGTVTITSDGYHILTGTVTGKNASSTNYFIALTKFWFRQATD